MRHTARIHNTPSWQADESHDHIVPIPPRAGPRSVGDVCVCMYTLLYRGIILFKYYDSWLLTDVRFSRIRAF